VSAWLSPGRFGLEGLEDGLEFREPHESLREDDDVDEPRLHRRQGDGALERQEHHVGLVRFAPGEMFAPVLRVGSHEFDLLPGEPFPKERQLFGAKA